MPLLDAPHYDAATPAHYVGLGDWMSVLDPLHRYRLITKDEFDRLKPGPMACAASKNYLTFGLVDMHLEAVGNSVCDYSNLIFVREDR